MVFSPEKIAFKLFMKQAAKLQLTQTVFRSLLNDKAIFTLLDDHNVPFQRTRHGVVGAS
jgi:hypothetical protein